MELMGFFYDNSEEKIEANGYPIPRHLAEKGYVQKNNADGVPRWYVMPNKVMIILNINGTNRKFNIYNNVMALYPNRSRISLKLAQEVIARIIQGNIEVTMKDGKPFLIEKAPKKAKRKGKSQK